jgi:cytochrome b
MVVAATGYLGERGGGEALEDAHAALAWTLLAVVGIHVAGVVLSSVLHRENLIIAMITGRKRGDPGDAIRRSHWLVAVALIALVAALWGGAIAVPGLDGVRAPSAVAGNDAGRHDRDD